jgi:hypothetical protein
MAVAKELMRLAETQVAVAVAVLHRLEQVRYTAAAGVKAVKVEMED